MTPRVVYLHGFASGPRSQKALVVRARLEREGVPVLVPDLNVPDFEHLRVSRAVDAVVALLDGPTVVAGSSLGGLIALHVAGRSAHVRSLVLMCPALVADERWKLMLGEAELARWRREGTRLFENFVTKSHRPVDYGFYEDLVAMARPPAPRVPVELIHGRRDPTVPLALSEAFAREHPNVRLTVVDDDHGLLGHTDLIEQAILDAARP